MNPGPRRNPPPSVAHRASTASSGRHSRIHTTCSPMTVTSGRHCSTNVLQRPGPEHQGHNRANPQLHSPHCAHPVQPPANSVLAARPPSQAPPAGGRGPTRLPSGPPALPGTNERQPRLRPQKLPALTSTKALKPAAPEAVRAAAPASRPRRAQAPEARQRATGAAGRKQQSTGGRGPSRPPIGPPAYSPGEYHCYCFHVETL
ncbi:hypothetical protein NDU88_003558 [Pleurodeles waltl]|uniref:Uncharacterized protein n=1 Tax=Pleurodeles waltl TaxID=8319 RepID=A0AAV7SFJ3_PLEWA|nr:hypothetical protein NDU88_003558 [Pleurodeles waltl]